MSAVGPSTLFDSAAQVLIRAYRTEGFEPCGPFYTVDTGWGWLCACDVPSAEDCLYRQSIVRRVLRG